jgi:PEP-CTERM motif
VTEVRFGVWNLPGDVITTVGWSITSAPNSGTIFGSGTANVSSSFQYLNGFGYNINQDSFLLSSLLLPAGTYFLNLQNAVVPSGDPAFWDENDGPSVAWESAVGYLAPVGNCEGGGTTGPYCSESFQILGTPGQQVPEPAPILLLGAGLAALALARRKKSV